MLSPCVKICIYNSTHKLCEGCGRTGAEIGDWLNLSDEKRRAVMILAQNRLATFAQKNLVKREQSS